MCGEEKKKQGEMSLEVEDNRGKERKRVGERGDQNRRQGGRERTYHYKVALIEKVRPWGHHQLSTNCVCC